MKTTTLLLTTLLLVTACNKNPGEDSSSSDQTVVDETTAGSSSGSTGTTTGGTTGGSTTGTTTGGTTTPTQTWTEEFMDLINDHRQSLGLRALIHDPGMEKIAQTHSQNMANGTVAFGHTGFSSRCSQARAVLGGGNLCAENVAYGQKTPQAAFNAWMNSSGHRANIEQSRVTHTGFGYAKSASGTYYWTQIFLEL
ncbi:CAP domain-containing protein [Peredibacter starrii]|uniref:CAP domain-containing protein n=1 Tax=Peredibacter starrii TaxID=28202 RepID=A0AAX4HJ20_9BACT|nr:CAP domain-containing protein [Peredibacter starrii]WPU63224.1 CAP domain-containing protein [Peredibacter starrii]